MKPNALEFGKEANFRIEDLDFTALGEAARCVEHGVIGGLEMQLDETISVLYATGESYTRRTMAAVGRNPIEHRGGSVRFVVDGQAAARHEQGV